MRDAQLTVCIPTKDRHGFLGRLLGYYAATGCRHWIFLGDSSGPDGFERNAALVAAFQNRLRIRHVAYPGLSACAAHEQLTRLLTTPYFVCLGDDDLLCPRGLDRCMAFLDAHPEYGAAHGVGLLISCVEPGAHGRIAHVGPYRQATLEASTGAQRFREFMSPGPYTLLFSVHRTRDAQAMFDGLGALEGASGANIFKDELIAASVSAVRNRVKALDGLYLIRFVHGGIFQRSVTYVYDWLTSPAWFPSYQRFVHRLTEELRQADGLSAAAAADVIREAFLPVLARGLAMDWRRGDNRQARAAGLAPRLRALARLVPGMRALRQGWQARQAWRQRHALSLSVLLDPRSPYYEDFQAVHRAITEIPAASGRPAAPARELSGVAS